MEQETAKVTPAVIEIRHQIHQNPELSNREEKTAALIADYLRKLGLEVQTGVARHGVVALLKGGRPGPVVAVRADIDALARHRADQPAVRVEGPDRRTSARTSA